MEVTEPDHGEEERQRISLTLTAWIGIAILGFWLTVAGFGPLFAPYGESEILSARSFAPAGEVGLLGSDYVGRDVFSRLLYGARMTIGLALITTLISFCVGITLGFTAAVSGGVADNVVQPNQRRDYGFSGHHPGVNGNCCARDLGSLSWCSRWR